MEPARLTITLGLAIHELSPNEHIAEARKLITATGYKRRLPELEYLEQLLANPT